MATATFTVAQTKTQVAYNATQVISVYTFTGAGDVSLALANLPPSVLAAALPFGSAHIVITSGSAPTSVSLLVGNDGINANLVPIGVPFTNFPAMVDTTSGVDAATQTVAETLASMPHSFHNYQILSAAAPSVITITEILMGTRG